ncbi:mitochondrial ribosomal protein L46 precursor, putative [Plasmodium gallinaceum]|uniref:Mitochondrial ribosomal protein L46, putative n=1 Tax=Plasmodium gallinaceum TaxID=5849 RepID=A0A1J1GN87_PLAGA|nr:mitochondrial ribosomal protein L46 precursor, putative [Plasmodium gallinaceum]CRG93845.1 mitochondrial ribosomal protein L46 precursor, putative [Plasmodium gallinaceum]
MIKKVVEKSILKNISQLNYMSLINKNFNKFFHHKDNTYYRKELKKKNILSDNRTISTNINISETKEIIVHDKYKVQVSLCIDRFPLNFVQEEFEKDFEKFKDEWLLRTNNNLEISEDFLHMKYNLSSFDEKKNSEKNILENSINYENKEKRKEDEDEDEYENESKEENEKKDETDDLEDLISLEGMQNIFKAKEKKKDDANIKEKKKNDIDINENDYKNIKRKPNNFLYLLVKYKKTNKWMFPLIDFKKNLTIRQNLKYLCSEHLKCEMPFFIGYCPCTFEKRKFKIPLLPNEIIGRKIFYYRAHYTNNEKNLDVAKNEYINDFAWLSRSELKNFLSKNKYHVIKDALPLT